MKVQEMYQILRVKNKLQRLLLSIYSHIYVFRGVFSFLKPGWLRGENVVQAKHFDACTLYFLKNRGGQNHPNHPGNYTSEQDQFDSALQLKSVVNLAFGGILKLISKIQLKVLNISMQDRIIDTTFFPEFENAFFIFHLHVGSSFTL